MDYKSLTFSGHALNQMFKRSISEEDVEQVLKNGMAIKEYINDKPYPSFLILGYAGKRPLHIVAAIDKNQNCYIVTAYEPDNKRWKNGFTNRIT